MAEIPEFEVPAFLKNQNTDQIHESMLDMIPDTLDKSEGRVRVGLHSSSRT